MDAPMRSLGIPALALLTLSVFAGCEETSNRPIGGTGGAAASGGSSSAVCAPACQTGFVCDASSSTCVECTQNSHCGAAQSCNTTTKKCVDGDPSGSGGSGGSGGEGAESGGQGGETASGGTDGGSGGNGSSCEPKVSLLIQRSGAMFNFPNSEDNWWSALTDALDAEGEDLLDQYVGSLDLSVRTFFMTEQGEQCLKGSTLAGPVKMDELAEFLDEERAAHQELLDDQAKVDAPLVEAMSAAAKDLETRGAGARKYLVLVLSGQPDACGEIDTDCVTDDAVKKVQELREEGVRVRLLYLASEGRFEGYPQALANAGRGYGIPNFQGDACGSDLEVVDSPMLAPFGAPQNVGELKQELGALFESIAVCD